LAKPSGFSKTEKDEGSGFLSFFTYQDKTIGTVSWFAHVAQLVEHILGKDEVISSILIMGSRQFCNAT
jgi:hypothetical protein